MAEEVAVVVKSVGAEATLCNLDDCSLDQLSDYDGIIVGSPTYYGLVSGLIKVLFDRSIVHHGKLEGKVGCSFSSAGVIGGGSETAVLSIIQMMLVHGIIVQGQAKGHHCGGVSISAPDEKVIEQCDSLVKERALSL